MVISPKDMKNKLLYIFILAIFSASFFYIGYMREPTPVPTSTEEHTLTFVDMIQSDKDRIIEIVAGVADDTATVTEEIKQELRALFAKYNMTDDEIKLFKLAGSGFIWISYDPLFFTDALESFKQGVPVKSEARVYLEEKGLILETLTADIIKMNDKEIERIAKKEPSLNPPTILTEGDIRDLLNYSITRLSRLDALFDE